MNRKIGVILSYIAMVFEVLSTLLLTPFIIRDLGEAEYGVYKLSASIVAYLLLLDLGVGNAVIRYAAKFRANNDEASVCKFLGITTIYYLIIGIIVILLGVGLVALFPYLFNKGLTIEETILGQKLLVIAIVNAGITLSTAGYANIIIAYEKFALSKGISIFSIIIKIVLTFILLKLGMGSMGIMLVQLLITIFARAIYILYVFVDLKLKPVFKGVNRSFIKEVFGYSSLILLQMIATQINASLDQILIGALVGGAAAIIGIYSIGIQIIQYFQSIGSAFTGVLMPGVVKMVEKEATPNELCAEMIRIGRIIFMGLGLIFVVFSVFGKQFIILWAGSGYEDAFLVTILLMLPHLFIITESMGSQILWARNQHKEQAMLKILIVLFNIFATILLIYWKPLLGATIGTMLSLLFGDVIVMNSIFKKKIKISLGEYYRGLFKGIVPCLLITWIFGGIFSLIGLNGWVGWIVNVAVMVVAYATCMLVFGLNKHEKSLIFSIFNKVFKRGK